MLLKGFIGLVSMKNAAHLMCWVCRKFNVSESGKCQKRLDSSPIRSPPIGWVIRQLPTWVKYHGGATEIPSVEVSLYDQNFVCNRRKAHNCRNGVDEVVKHPKEKNDIPVPNVVFIDALHVFDEGLDAEPEPLHDEIECLFASKVRPEPSWGIDGQDFGGASALRLHCVIPVPRADVHYRTTA